MIRLMNCNHMNCPFPILQCEDCKGGHPFRDHCIVKATVTFLFFVIAISRSFLTKCINKYDRYNLYYKQTWY